LKKKSIEFKKILLNCENILINCVYTAFLKKTKPHKTKISFARFCGFYLLFSISLLISPSDNPDYKT